MLCSLLGRVVCVCLFYVMLVNRVVCVKNGSLCALCLVNMCRDT